MSKVGSEVEVFPQINFKPLCNFIISILSKNSLRVVGQVFSICIYSKYLETCFKTIISVVNFDSYRDNHLRVGVEHPFLTLFDHYLV